MSSYLKNFKFEIFFLVILLFLEVIISSVPKHNITRSEDDTNSEIIKKISLSEKKTIEYFFRDFVVEYSFGYVLLGDKPMSLSTYYNFNLLPSSKNSFLYFIPKNFKAKKGFDLWEKYTYLFPVKNYLIIKELNPWNPKNEMIFFINKKTFVRAGEDNIEVFQTILKRKIIPSKLLAEAENHSLLKDILQKNDFFIGVLLGYGKNNAKIFHSKNNDPYYRNDDFKYLWYDNDLNKNIILKNEING